MKITVIGGGSTYTPELVSGFLARIDSLPLTELWLMDIDPARLEIVGGFAQRMVKAKGAPFQVILSTDQRRAIAGASYVITQLRLGMMPARRGDEYLGWRHGLIGQETTGVGGMAKALRTIPVILSIAQDIRENAPEALLANFTNPAGLVTEALSRYAPDVPAVVRELTPLGIASALAVNLSFGGSLGEEPGWRGVWLPRLLRGERPLGASLTMAVAWALWHAPIDLSQGFGGTGVFALVARLVWTLPITLVFTWVTMRAGGSVLPALALHTGINTIPDFAMRDPGRYERAMELYVVLMLALGIAVALLDRRRRRPVAAA